MTRSVNSLSGIGRFGGGGMRCFSCRALALSSVKIEVLKEKEISLSMSLLRRSKGNRSGSMNTLVAKESINWSNGEMVNI
jgi:hypothetical protein